VVRWRNHVGSGLLRRQDIAYRQPPAPSGDNALKALALSQVALSPASVPTITAATSVTATANHAQASVAILSADADSATAGHQVALAEGGQPDCFGGDCG